MKNIKGCLLHQSDEWQTPKKLYDPLMELGFIDCFPYKATYNEFEKTYKNEKLFVNPPFSKLKDIPKWLDKQIENGCQILLLMPTRTDTEYFKEIYIKYRPFIYFLKGRLRFNESKPAPFPTMLLHITGDTTAFYGNYMLLTIENLIEWMKIDV